MRECGGCINMGGMYSLFMCVFICVFGQEAFIIHMCVCVCVCVCSYACLGGRYSLLSSYTPMNMCMCPWMSEVYV